MGGTVSITESKVRSPGVQESGVGSLESGVGSPGEDSREAIEESGLPQMSTDQERLPRLDLRSDCSMGFAVAIEFLTPRRCHAGYMLETEGFAITTVRKPSASISSTSQSVARGYRSGSRLAGQQRHLADTSPRGVAQPRRSFRPALPTPRREERRTSTCSLALANNRFSSGILHWPRNGKQRRAVFGGE